MWLLDQIYCYSYTLLLRTPGRKEASDSAAWVVAIVILVHIVAVLGLVGKLTNRNLLFAFGRTGVVVATLLIIAVCAYYYIIRKHGAKLLKEFGARVDSLRSVFIGIAIVLWTVAFPVVVGAVLILRHTHI